jgi:hypothetical protein
MRKFTYSRQIVTLEGVETFTASEFDSFEEGQKAVEKGIYDRRLQIPMPVSVPAPVIPTGQTIKVPGPSTTLNSNETGGNTKTE